MVQKQTKNNTTKKEEVQLAHWPKSTPPTLSKQVVTMQPQDNHTNNLAGVLPDSEKHEKLLWKETS